MALNLTKFINIKKTFAYLHYASNILKFEKIRSDTVGAVDYTLQCIIKIAKMTNFEKL